MSLTSAILSHPSYLEHNPRDHVRDAQSLLLLAAGRDGHQLLLAREPSEEVPAHLEDGVLQRVRGVPLHPLRDVPEVSRGTPVQQLSGCRQVVWRRESLHPVPPLRDSQSPTRQGP